MSGVVLVLVFEMGSGLGLGLGLASGLLIVTVMYFNAGTVKVRVLLVA